MPTTLTFDITSKSACAPLICGVGNHVVVKLKSACIAKSWDGSGYLVAPITVVARTVGLTWRYTVVVPDTQLASGATLSQADVESSIGCISQVDACLFAKIAANLATEQNWQTVSVAVPASSGATLNTYMFRRATAFKVHAMEIGMESPVNAVTVQLQVSGANNTTYTDIGLPATITPPAFSARRAFSSPLSIPAGAAVRAKVTTASGIYAASTYVDIHLFTTEP
jgi:hypothetical protein